MPRGIYKRKPFTEKHLKILRKPRTPAQKKQIYELGKRPRTEIQIEHARKHACKLSKLPITQAQRDARRKNIKKGGIFGNDILCHHNDLCHGQLRPDDVKYMTMREHMSLHQKIRVENGIHHFLTKNRKD